MTKYPNIFKAYQNEKYRRYSMWYGFEGIDDGWFDIIDETAAKLEKYLNSKNVRNSQDIFAAQVKEKFGELRFYVNTYDDYIREVTDEAYLKSKTTCMTCGAPGKLRPEHGWVTTLCDTHNNEAIAETIANGGRIRSGKELEFVEASLNGQYELAEKLRESINSERGE